MTRGPDRREARTPLDIAVADVKTELERATKLFPPMHSAHEGYAIIKEEFDELWLEVMKNPTKRSKSEMRIEAMQVAAMAIRFMMDVT